MLLAMRRASSFVSTLATAASFSTHGSRRKRAPACWRRAPHSRPDAREDPCSYEAQIHKRSGLNRLSSHECLADPQGSTGVRELWFAPDRLPISTKFALDPQSAAWQRRVALPLPTSGSSSHALCTLWDRRACDLLHDIFPLPESIPKSDVLVKMAIVRRNIAKRSNQPQIDIFRLSVERRRP
jgi:hypothetical protein